MNPDFGGDFDQDLLELWGSESSLDMTNTITTNTSTADACYNMNNDVPMEFTAPQFTAAANQYCIEYQENYFPCDVQQLPKSVMSARSNQLPSIRQLRSSTSKKLSFSSTDSSISFDYSSEESFPTTPTKRQKRIPRSKSTPIKKSPSNPRGRGRPKKDDDEADDDKLVHKRKYARAYREQHQQAVKNYQQCALDFFNTLVASGINVKQKFPQHSKIIQKLVEKTNNVKATATRASSRRRY